jgi:hypothetical protein
MSSISSVGMSFGYTNAVLANDDTLPVAPTPATTTTTTTSPAVAPATTTTAQPQSTPTQKVELGNLQWESQLAAALLPSPSTGVSSVFFTGASMAGLLNAHGVGALAYLTPQGAPASGSIINSTA